MFWITGHSFLFCTTICQVAYVTNVKGDFEVISNKLLLLSGILLQDKRLWAQIKIEEMSLRSRKDLFYLKVIEHWQRQHGDLHSWGCLESTPPHPEQPVAATPILVSPWYSRYSIQLQLVCGSVCCSSAVNSLEGCFLFLHLGELFIYLFVWGFVRSFGVGLFFFPLFFSPCVCVFHLFGALLFWRFGCFFLTLLNLLYCAVHLNWKQLLQNYFNSDSGGPRWTKRFCWPQCSGEIWRDGRWAYLMRQSFPGRCWNISVKNVVVQADMQFKSVEIQRF